MTRYISILAMCFELVAAAPPEPLVGRIRKTAEQFWTDFSSVACSETVHQTKFTTTGKLLLERRSQYDYLVLLQWDGSDLSIDESRLIQGKPAKEANAPLLTTRGFSTMLLILHPIYADSFQFTRLPDDSLDGKPALHLHFEHIAGQRSPSILQVRGRDYPLEWEGDVWLDPSLTGALRIKASLKTPLTDIGIKNMETDVHYGSVSFAKSPPLQWMPLEAKISVDTLRHRWRNDHRFTAYRRFDVDTSVKIDEPGQTK